MQTDRRGFTTGALAFAASASIAAKVSAQIAPALSQRSRAVALIRAYAEAHCRWFNLPGLTVGATSPSGFSSVLECGFADPQTQRPITGDTLFQIGSISKSFTAAMIHQFAAEGRIRLSDRIVSVLPGTPLPADSPVEVQHLLDHVAGLADGPALFVSGGLWTAYPPGEHWHYSNTGYDLLGHLAQHVGGKPLRQLLRERLFAPLRMEHSRGAIIAADRTLYAQGFEGANVDVPFVRGMPLAPAAWVDETSAAGSIASTAADMNLYLRSLAAAAMGKGGMGLAPAQGVAFTSHSVPSDSDEMAYGNGLMHVEADGRKYLHHTGGMVSFTSAFHVDTGNGVGAFASTPLSAFSGYRPRDVTLFAVKALAAAEAGHPLPEPPPVDPPIADAGDYVGRYASGSRSFVVRGGARLTIAACGTEARLEPAGGDSFVTLHPLFRDFSISFERSGKAVTGASWGPDSFVRDGAKMAIAPHDPALQRLAGRYVNSSPWLGTIVIVERGGKLWGGTDTPFTRTGPNSFRIGGDDWSPERGSFANFIDGRPQTFIFSGDEFARQDI